ncbi:peptide receptor gpcr [Plakobranchus ocellatus]|uniref:Peptide receptor gpcr n=1 Tax=Plakobranchus ocellatus TaxID=259542 RepID=A0AAV4C5D5_9GAST|nr:peptide receptor gpcr [Plakobranchus ocellatus]
MEQENGTLTDSFAAPALQAGDSLGDIVMFYIGVVLKLYVNPALGFGGILVNIINTFIFYKMGLSDGVTQNFLILSIFDGILSICAAINSLCYILLTTMFTRGGFIAHNLQAVLWATVISWPFSQTISCITTTVIAVVRCCCVALPLQVKQVLTARRQLVAIFIFSAVTEGVLLYVFIPSRLVILTDPVTNITQAAYIDQNYDTLNIFTNIFLYITFVIIIVCVVILTISLNQSSKFRDKSSSSNEKSKEKSREIRVVQTVILVALIFILCNLPTIILSIIRQFVDGFSIQGHPSRQLARLGVKDKTARCERAFGTGQKNCVGGETTTTAQALHQRIARPLRVPTVEGHGGVDQPLTRGSSDRRKQDCII